MRSFRLTRLRASLAPIAAAALALAPTGCGSDTEDPKPDTGVDVSDVSTDTSADASADASEDASADATADAGQDAADEADAAPFVMELPSGNYAAAATSDPDTYVAVILGEDQSILAYACDSKTRGQWFTGNALSVPTVLSSTDYTGAESFLYLDLQDDKVVGSISTGAEDAYPLTFALPKVEQPVLYRGSYAVTDQEVLGGWIVLPDGSQRGLTVSKDTSGTTSSSQTLDTNTLTTSTATCDPNATPLPASFTVTMCLPFTGCVSNTVSTDTRPQFNVVTFGDSFGAGEGAPEAFASGCKVQNNGTSIGCTTPAIWNSGDPDSSFCHRSPHAGSALAVKKLQDEFPQLNINFKNLACTGAVIANIFKEGQTSELATDDDGNIVLDDNGNSGPSNKAWPREPATLPDGNANPNSGKPLRIATQAQQLKTFIESKLCSTNDGAAECWSGLDALVMNIGGNDADFAEILKIAMRLDDEGCDDGGHNDDRPSNVRIESLLEAALNGDDTSPGGPGSLGEKFTELAASLNNFRFSSCRFGLPVPSARFLVELPSLATRADGQLCSDADFGTMNQDIVDRGLCSQGDEPYVADINTCEVAVFESKTESSVAQKVRAVFSDSKGPTSWSFISGVYENSLGHGLCVSSLGRFYNTNCEANRQQGNDLFAEEALNIYGDDLSMGIAHPNRQGFKGMYETPIADALRAKILTKFAPIPPSNLRLTGLTKTVSGSGVSTITTLTASLSWADRSSTESSFKFVPAVVGALNSEMVINSANRDGTGTASGTIVLKHAGSIGSVTVGLKACSEIGVCSDGPSLIVSGDIPTVALEPSTASTTTNASSAVTALVMWNQLTGPAVQFFEVEFYASSDSVRVSNAKLIHKQPLLANGGIPVATFATSTKIPSSGKLRMRACNFTGCGPYSAIKSYPF